jgi:D-alanyl-D-alanine carboxypeptidase
MSARVQRVLVGITLFLVLVAGVSFWKRRTLVAVVQNWGELKEGKADAEALKTVDDLVDYLAAHPDAVSLVTWRVEDGSHAFVHRGEVARPLASTVKLAVLATYAEQVAAKTLDPKRRVPVAQWDALALPGTDGGAHDAAVAELTASDFLENGTVALADVAWAMVRFGDLAAIDLLMLELGRDAIERTAVDRGLAALPDDAPYPLSGELLQWRSSSVHGTAAQTLEQVSRQGRRAYVDEAWRLAALLRSDAAFREREAGRLREHGFDLGVKEQAQLAQSLGARGTAMAFARLLSGWAKSEVPGAAQAQDLLEWPMTLEATRTLYDAMGTQSGALPGIITSTTWGKPKSNRPARVAALFFERLPNAVWLHLLRTSLHQELESRLIENEAFVEKVKGRLGAPRVPSGT